MLIIARSNINDNHLKDQQISPVLPNIYNIHIYRVRSRSFSNKNPLHTYANNGTFLPLFYCVLWNYLWFQDDKVDLVSRSFCMSRNIIEISVMMTIIYLKMQQMLETITFLTIHPYYSYLRIAKRYHYMILVHYSKNVQLHGRFYTNLIM